MNQQTAALAASSHDMLIAVAVAAAVVVVLVAVVIRAARRAGVDAGRAAAQEVARVHAAQVQRRPRRAGRGLLVLALAGVAGLAWEVAAGRVHLPAAAGKPAAPAPAPRPAPAPAPHGTSAAAHTVTRIVHMIPLTGTELTVIAVVTVVCAAGWLIQRARASAG